MARPIHKKLSQTVAERANVKWLENKLLKEFKREVKETVKYLERKGIHEYLYADAQAQRAKWFGTRSGKPRTKEEQERWTEKAMKDITPDRDWLEEQTEDWDDEVQASKRIEPILHQGNLRAGNTGGTMALVALGIIGPDDAGNALGKAGKVVGGTLGNQHFNLTNSRLLQELKRRGTKITGVVTKNTLARFRKILVDQYYYNGGDPRKVAKAIYGMFPATKFQGLRARADNIARTETATAQSIVEHETYKENLVEKHTWVATGDGLTRPSHVECAGQEPIPIDERFINGLLYPHDPAGPPREVCRCRCAEGIEKPLTQFCKVEGGDGEACTIPWTGGPPRKKPKNLDKRVKEAYAKPMSEGGLGLTEMMKMSEKEFAKLQKFLNAGKTKEAVNFVGKYSSRNGKTISKMSDRQYKRAMKSVKKCKGL